MGVSAEASPPRRVSRRSLVQWVAVPAALLFGLGSVSICVALVNFALRFVAPMPVVVGPPPNALADAATISFASQSGSVLRGWYLPATRPGGGGVVLAHGYRETRGMMVRRAAVLHEHGFGVLLFDFQAEGESPGAHITLGYLEGFDVRAAVDELHRRLPGERVGALGVSLGGAAIALAPRPLAVDAAVFESTFPTLDSTIRNRLKLMLPAGAPDGIVPVLVPLLEAVLPPALGVGVEAMRPIDHIGGIGAPVLMLAGTSDTSTTLAEAKSLFMAARQPKTLWEVEGAGHVDLEAFGPAAYWAHVLPFLTAALQR